MSLAGPDDFQSARCLARSPGSALRSVSRARHEGPGSGLRSASRARHEGPGSGLRAHSLALLEGPGSGLRSASRARHEGPGSGSGTACRRSRQAGFTLIEVMAAFMVFSLLFGVVLQILSTSVGNTRMSGDFTQAALWAQSKLDAVGLESMIEPGVTQGDFDERFSWTMEIEETAVADGRGLATQEELPIVLYHVRLTVAWGEGNRGRQAVFETLRSVDINWQERQRGER